MTTPSKYIACIIPRIPFFALRTSHSTALYFILSSKPLPSKLRFIGLSQHQNNVGYNSLAVEEGTTFKSFGPSEMSVGGDGIFKLGEVLKVGEEYDASSDHLYIVNPETGDADYELCYYNEEQAKKIGGAGWYDYNYLDPFSEEPFDIGVGFETCASGNALSFISSGEVCTEGYAFDCTGITFGIAVNATARALNWKQISVGGEYDASSDHLYILNPETGDADYELCYYNEEQAKKIGGAGWYDYNYLDPFNEETLNPGEGVETCVSGNEVYIVFPALND